MGNNCAPEKKKPESVINLSETCVERLTREDKERKYLIKNVEL